MNLLTLLSETLNCIENWFISESIKNFSNLKASGIGDMCFTQNLGKEACNVSSGEFNIKF